MKISPSAILSSALITITLFNQAHCQLFPHEDPSIDYYCGVSWNEARNLCSMPCPSGLDTDCPPGDYGRSRRCYAAAGCAARTERLTWYGVMSLRFDKFGHLSGDNELKLMSDAEIDSFQEAMKEFLNDGLQGEMEIDCFEVLEQEYDRPCVGAVIPDRQLSTANSTSHYYCGTDWLDAQENCILPCPSKLDSDCPNDSLGNARSCYAATGCQERKESTSLDLEVKVCGLYIPEIGEILMTPSDFENDILRIITNREQLALEFIASSSSFFNAITGVNAISEDMMVDPPSASPSESPTRPYEVSMQTYLDARPAGSYGIFFSVRTLVNVTTILLTGMAFLTPHDGMVEYEVYSRIGKFSGYEGRLEEWDLIARGETVGRGSKELTPILNETDDDDVSGYIGFTPVHVPGNRGMRSFYITTTDKYTMLGKVAVPLSFSASSVDANDGKPIYSITESNEEMEILEGDGVLDYPAPKNRDGINDIYYRRPRGFIGSFEYTRDACYPTTDFYGWPCPYIPKTIPYQTEMPVLLSTNHTARGPTQTNLFGTANNNVKSEYLPSSVYQGIDGEIENDDTEDVAANKGTSSSEHWVLYFCIISMLFMNVMDNLVVI